MSCGLGAIVLVFLLMKPDVREVAVNESGKLQVEIESIRDEESELDDRVAKTRFSLEEGLETNQLLSVEISRLEKQLSENKRSLDRKRSYISEIKASVINTPTKKSSDIIQDEHRGEEEYLLGLKVEGERVVFLVDASSSMTDEYLVDIIKRKSMPDRVKKAGPKWVRTKKVVRWLLSRLPRSSWVSVVSYSDDSKLLGGSDWHQASVSAGLSRIIAELDDIVPAGATNLHKGLLKVKSLSPEVTNIYIVTDGLPTTGQSNFSRLNPFSDCFSLLGRSNNISGKCRSKLFRQTILDTSSGFNVPVNVILLPLEGDPRASPDYWEWTATTGGLLISPAKSWP